MGALQKLVFVLGPTCSGKTRLSVDLALALGGEVINIDSQQVYRGFDVGTAKPTEAEKRGVPHHLFSAVDPGDNFDAASYVRLADEAIAGVVARGRIPVFAGGTLLYVRALTQGLARIPEIPQDIRNSVRIEVAEGGCEKAHKRLESVDPGSAKRISPGDTQRIQRALEVFDATGVAITEYQRAHGFSESRYASLRIAIRWPRAELHRRINERTVELFKGGFIDEVRGLVARGYAPVLQSFKAHGYRYCAEVVAGTMTVQRAIELTARDTRRYAKRQETWLRSEPGMNMVDAPDCAGALDLARRFVAP